MFDTRLLVIAATRRREGVVKADINLGFRRLLFLVLATMIEVKTMDENLVLIVVACVLSLDIACMCNVSYNRYILQ